jgi:hypothetical protein
LRAQLGLAGIRDAPPHGPPQAPSTQLPGGTKIHHRNVASATQKH